MDDDKKLKQLIVSAQQELNRLNLAQKYRSRKEKTYRKIVFGGEVAKYMGLDIDHDIVIGYLMKFPALTEREVATLKIRGAEARRLGGIRKLQDRKSSLKTKSENDRSSVFSARLDKSIKKGQ